MKIKGLKETLIRRNGEVKEWIWKVQQIEGNWYFCEKGFKFNIITGEIDPHPKGAKIGQEFDAGLGRIGKYELIIEEEEQQQIVQEQPQEEATVNQPTTLVKEWRYEDGRIEEKDIYPNGRLWEKGGHKRMYFNTYGRGAYVDLKTNAFHPDRKKVIPLGVWEKPWGSKVEVRWRLK